MHKDRVGTPSAFALPTSSGSLWGAIERLGKGDPSCSPESAGYFGSTRSRPIVSVFSTTGSFRSEAKFGKLAALGQGYPAPPNRAYNRAHVARSRRPLAPWLDHRRLRHRRHRGGLHGAPDRHFSRPGHHPTAQGPDPELCLGETRPWGGRGPGWYHQGRRRRSRRDPPGPGAGAGAGRTGGQRRHLHRRRRRRHGDPAGPAARGRRARHQPGAPAHDDGRRAGDRRAALRPPGPGDRGVDPRRRGAREENPQRPARDRGRAFGARHHRHRHSLFLLVLDPFDPPGHRRRASNRPHAPRRRHRVDLRGGGANTHRPTRAGTARYGRLRRRHLEIPARSSGGAPDAGRRLRQVLQAGPGRPGPPLRPQPGGYRGAGRVPRRVGRGGGLAWRGAPGGVRRPGAGASDRGRPAPGEPHRRAGAAGRRGATGGPGRRRGDPVRPQGRDPWPQPSLYHKNC